LSGEIEVTDRNENGELYATVIITANLKVIKIELVNLKAFEDDVNRNKEQD